MTKSDVPGTLRRPLETCSAGVRSRGAGGPCTLGALGLVVLCLVAPGAVLAQSPGHATASPRALGLPASEGPAGSKPISAKWGQYQADAGHDGVARDAGPARPTLNWSAVEGAGSLALVAEGPAVYASSYESETINEASLAGGATLRTLTGPLQDLDPVATSTDLYYVQEYGYSCGIFCTAYDSELVDYNTHSATTTWTTPLGYQDWRWGVTEGNGYLDVDFLGSGILSAYLASTGASLWTVSLPHSINTLPTYGGGLVVVGFTGTPNVTALSYYTAKTAWSFTPDAWVGSPAITYATHRFYFGTLNGSLYALSSKGKLVWVHHDGGIPIETTPTVGLHMVYFTAGQTVYALNETTGRLVWKQTLEGEADVSPVLSLHGRTLYTGDSSGNLYALDALTGRVHWEYALSGPVADGLVLGDHTLIASTVDGFVYDFGSPGPAPTLPTVAQAEWDQYQENAAHQGDSNAPGPANASLLWNLSAGTSALGLTDVGDSLLVADPGANTVQQWNLASGASIGSNLASGVVESTFGVQGTDDLEMDFAQSYGYPCGILCTAYNSELVARTYADQGSASGPDPWIAQFSLATDWEAAQSDGITLLASVGGSTLYAFSADDGLLLWTATLPDLIATVPTVGAGLVVVGYSNSANVTALDVFTGATVWNFSTSAPISSPSVSYGDGLFYFGTSLGTLYGVNAAGAAAWSFKDKAMGAISTTASVAGGLVLFGTSNGYTYALDASNGTKLWDAHGGSALTASPVIASNALVYTGTASGEVLALDVSNGTQVWKYTMPASINDGLLLADGLLVVGDSNGDLDVFQ